MANLTALFETAFDEIAAASWEEDLLLREKRIEETARSQQAAKALGHICMHCDVHYLYT